MYSECFKSEFFESEKLEEFKELLKLAGKLKLENKSREHSNTISKLYTAEKIDDVVNIIRNIGMEIDPSKLKEKVKSYLIKECYVPNIHTENYPNLNVKSCKVGYEVKMSIETVIETLVSGKIAVVEIGQALSNNEFLKDLNELEKEALVEVFRYNYLSLNLRGINLSGSDLRGVNLEGAELNEANLNKANLSEAVLIWAKLRGAKLIGANLSWTNLEGVC